MIPCPTCGHPSLPRHTVGEAVDVYLEHEFAWTEGIVHDILPSKGCYRIKTVDMQIASMSPFVEMSVISPYVKPHRTHCRANWRDHLDSYQHLECLVGGRHAKKWVACRVVRRCKIRDRLLVMFERNDQSLDSRWFPVDSPCLRYLWDWE